MRLFFFFALGLKNVSWLLLCHCQMRKIFSTINGLVATVSLLLGVGCNLVCDG